MVAFLPLGARRDAGGVALSPWWWAWVGGNDFPLVASGGWVLSGGWGWVWAIRVAAWGGGRV